MISALNKALLAKIETIVGTDAVPTAALNAVRVKTGTVTVDGSPLEIDVIKQTFGKITGPFVGKQLQLDVEFYVRSSGTLGVSPDWAPIAHAAAHTVVATAATDVKINPITVIGNLRHTSTFHWFEDGLKFAFVGAVCSSFSIDSPMDDFVLCKATIIAPYATPVLGAIPAGLVYQVSQPVLATPTDIFNDNAVATPVGSLTFDSSISGVVRRLIGGSDALVSDRPHPKITFTKDSLGTVADYTRLTAVNAGTVSAVFGVAGGNRISLTAPKAYFSTVKHAANDSVQQRDIEMLLDENAGDDAYQIVID